ncbi:MAG TPA: peptide chain release factor 2, partial [Rhodospirillaceae bacterium]|nr:peptide chain release factor 2 [Rhodospirillaceae bacterium]
MFDPDRASKRLDELNAEAEGPDLWIDQDRAQKIMRERNQVEKSLTDFRKLEQELSDAIELIEMGEAEGDNEIVEEAEATLHRLQKFAVKQELQTLLSGEADSNDCFLEVHAGAGGTESQDWADMLRR